MKVDTQIIRCFTQGFSWVKLRKAIFIDKAPSQEKTLETSIEEAKQAWLTALQQMEYADQDLVESAILLATACEKRYIALLQEAKEQHFTVWDQNKLAPLVANDQ